MMKMRQILPTPRSGSMRKATLFAAILTFSGASYAAAQQAAMPTPPKTVNPTPQSTTSCRGCSDDNDVKKKPLEAYDRKPTDSVVKRQATATKAVASKPVAKKQTQKSPAKKHVKRPAKKSPVKHPLKPKPDTVKKK